jgi:hypothetical protein
VLTWLIGGRFTETLGDFSLRKVRTVFLADGVEIETEDIAVNLHLY